MDEDLAGMTPSREVGDAIIEQVKEARPGYENVVALLLRDDRRAAYKLGAVEEEKADPIPRPMRRVVLSIHRERLRQDNKWGQQCHPAPVWLAILSEEMGEVAQAILWARFDGVKDTRVEAPRVRDELVHVAAVAVAMIEAIDDDRCPVGQYVEGDMDDPERKR